MNVLQQLHANMKDLNSFDFQIVDGQPKITKLSIPEKMNKRNNDSFHAEKIGRIAAFLTGELQQLKRTTITEIWDEPTVQTARCLFKKIRKKYDSDPRIRQLQKELQAAKLCLTAKTLDNNPGFEVFAQETHLERPLSIHKHSLVVDGDDKIAITQNAKMTPWEKVQETLQKEMPLIVDHKPRQPWMYGHDGVQNKDCYQWKTLTPFMYEDPKNWGDRYIFEYCVTCSVNFQAEGDHSWFRLRTPKGEVYSIGIYRPNKDKVFDRWSFPLRVQTGSLQSPDISEYWPSNIHTLPIEITKDDFEHMVKQIEKDNLEHLTFQTTKNNCLAYCNRIALIAGIKLPTEETAVRVIMPRSLLRTVDYLFFLAPRIVKRTAFFPIMVFFHFVHLILGCNKVDKKVVAIQEKHLNKSPKDIEREHRRLQGPKDLLSPDPLMMHPPQRLAHGVREEICTWRERKIKVFSDRKTELEKILLIKNIEDNFIRFKTIKEMIAEENEKLDRILYNIPTKYKVEKVIPYLRT